MHATSALSPETPSRDSSPMSTRTDSTGPNDSEAPPAGIQAVSQKERTVCLRQKRLFPAGKSQIRACASPDPEGQSPEMPVSYCGPTPPYKNCSKGKPSDKTEYEHTDGVCDCRYGF